jgi:hypothetical protein
MTTARHHSAPAPRANADALVLDYLANLWAATEDLAPELRDEVMAAVADFVALRRTDADDPATAEMVLQLLGPPQEIAAAVRRGRRPLPMLLRPQPHSMPPMPPPVAPPPVAPRPAPETRGNTTAYAAILLLTIGPVIMPFVAQVIGITLVCTSPRWNRSQKTAGALLVFGALVMGFLFAGVLGAAADAEVALLGFFAAGVAGAWAAAAALLPTLVDDRSRRA